MKEYFKIFTIGFLMGTVDVVPGVSGGTVALICNIYERLIKALSQIPHSIVLIFKLKIKEAWKLVDANFLLCLLLGVVIAIFSMAKIITFLLNNYPVFVWSFFLGLILASILFMYKDIKNYTNSIKNLLLTMIGIIIALLFSVGLQLSLNITPFTLVFSGAIAICAMILPGISGSFILLILGIYAPIISFVHSFNFINLMYFFIGCLIGVTLFSKFLFFLLKKFYDRTMSLMLGIMIGSLPKLWPYKKTLVAQLLEPSNIKVPIKEELITSSEYLLATGEDPYVVLFLMITILSFSLILILKYLIISKKNV